MIPFHMRKSYKVKKPMFCQQTKDLHFNFGQPIRNYQSKCTRLLEYLKLHYSSECSKIKK